ncbi:MAG: zinc dependent phospholipase C family protein [Candidatus Acidiferrales bacterium]
MLSHEAIIDAAWDVAIKPLLLKRFPGSTPEQLKEAHSYAYGGSVIQDLGYYPFGRHFFSDLVHYVRSGDFVQALLRDSTDLDEYAFALGALAHYASDNEGHRLAVNKSVPMLYPKLRRKYGDVVTYDESPSAHLKTEFGFDVLQVARGHYASDAYHDFIGFQVSKDLLNRAFKETYCLDLKAIFADYDLALGTYRHAVSGLIPEMTKVAWQTKKNDIQKETPGMTKKKFLYHISRASYEKQWAGHYQKPSLGTKLLAFFFRLIPKIGPFSVFSFKVPPPQAEQLFMASFNGSLTEYERFLREDSEKGKPVLINDNFDTGTVTKPGEYPLADKTYAQLLDLQAKQDFKETTAQLRQTILDFYSDPNAPITTKKDKKEWAKVMREVGELKAFTPSPQPPPAPAATKPSVTSTSLP